MLLFAAVISAAVALADATFVATFTAAASNVHILLFHQVLLLVRLLLVLLLQLPASATQIIPRLQMRPLK